MLKMNLRDFFLWYFSSVMKILCNWISRKGNLVLINKHPLCILLSRDNKKITKPWMSANHFRYVKSGDLMIYIIFPVQYLWILMIQPCVNKKNEGNIYSLARDMVDMITPSNFFWRVTSMLQAKNEN